MALAKVLAVAALAVLASGLAAGGLLRGGYPRGPTPAFGGGFNGPPQPYSFQYLVRDPPSGNDFGQKESGDGSGAVRGEYHVVLPDGRRQTVTYSASDATGYVADVQYSGTPHYPSGPSGGFGGGYGGGHGGYGGGLASTYLPPHGK